LSKFFDKIRTIILIVMLLTAMGLAFFRLMKIQIVEGEELLKQSVYRTEGTQEILATRGEIVDMDFNPLVQNKVSYNVIIEEAFFPNDNALQNEIILKTAKFLKEGNFPLVENIPISTEQPYTYLTDKDTLVSKLKTNLRLNKYATPQNCIDKLIEKYEIADTYTDEEVRIIAGVRYEMISTQFSVGNRYTFAKDISIEMVTKLKELSYMLQGVDVVGEPIRFYPDGAVFPHGLGTTGLLDADEYEKLKEQGKDYNFNDTIGKSGIESVMEDELRGENGERNIILSSSKKVVSIEDTIPSVAGNTVKLTINKDFQKQVQDILADTINKLHDNPAGEKKGIDAEAGAVVVMDAKTGAIRAMATYPSYNMDDYQKNYTAVSQGAFNPLINRAIDGVYRPGSTFKPITATMLLNEGLINETTTFNCARLYMYYDHPKNCTGTHGNITVAQAIEHSCNIFFYKAIQLANVDMLVDYQKQFGFNTDLNFELGGNIGYLASPETMQKFGMDWSSGLFLEASIGQSEIGVSPLNMALEALTVANKGVRYRPYIVDSVWSYDRETLISKTEPIIDNVIEDKTGRVFDVVREGMINASKNTMYSPFTTDKASESLVTLPYPVAIKTGTPQRGSGTDSAVIGFYPAENPEIAFSVFIEKGEYSKYAVRKIINAYYGYDKDVQDDQILIAN